MGCKLADGAAGCARDLHGHAHLRAVTVLGDTRIQALISYAVATTTGWRNRRSKLSMPRASEGITRSRYPSSLVQTIPTFSLLWIGMVRDWWNYRPIRSLRALRCRCAHRARLVCALRTAGRAVAQAAVWSFIDWVPKGAIPTYDANGESCMTTLQYLGALDDAAALERGWATPCLQIGI